jgi:asparagine synthase (glutamine-hydrolysing)
MCGIWGYIVLKNKHAESKLFTSFMKVQPRGPDRSDFKIINEFTKIYSGFHRRAIMDRSSYGDQPFTLEIKDETQHRSIYSETNGEIYNFHQLVEENEFKLRSRSDCEFLPHMYAKYGFKKMIQSLRGEFATCIIDIDHLTDNITIYLGRDQMAVRPLFVGQDTNGICFSSTLSGIIDLVDPKSIRQLDRAEIITINIKKDKVSFGYDIYHLLDEKGIDPRFITEKPLIKEPLIKEHMLIQPIVFKEVHDTLVDAVKCRLESDRPIGALLSGGLDSSLVVSIASACLKKTGKKLRTFSIGIPGSTDKEYAEMVSKFCDTDHTHVEFTEQQFLDAIEDVIIATETYDTTTVRASVGQYLISRWIKENTDIIVLFIGDGSDEVAAGYMYFHNAPTPYASHMENVRLVQDIRFFDSLRADRCIAYNGLEARVPFLDHMFVDLYLSIPYEYRIPIQESSGRKVEKWLLRKSFDRINPDTDKPYLPAEVLWRKKEAFSDGVSSKQKSWYQIIQDNIESVYGPDDLLKPEINFHITPKTKESLHYRLIFNKHFHPEAAYIIPYYWLPKWCGDIIDPSARVLKVYED